MPLKYEQKRDKLDIRQLLEVIEDLVVESVAAGNGPYNICNQSPSELVMLHDDADLTDEQFFDAMLLTAADCVRAAVYAQAALRPPKKEQENSIPLSELLACLGSSGPKGGQVI